MSAGRGTAAAAPLVAVDSVHIQSDTRLVAHKRISADDPYLAGHYPGAPIYPGVFLVESVRQAVEHLVCHRQGPGHRAELATLSSARFTAALVDGDLLALEVDCTPEGDGHLDASARCTTHAGRPAGSLRLRLRVQEPVTDGR